MKIACIGSGVFSIALAKQMTRKKENQIYIWTHDAHFKEEAVKHKKLSWPNEKVKQDSNIAVTTSLEEALKDAQVVFLLVASAFLKDTVLEIKKYYPLSAPLFIGSKGLINEKPYYISKYCKNVLKAKRIAFFAGPNFAQDILHNAVTTITVGTKDKKDYLLFKSLFGLNIKVEWMKETQVLELTSVLKNIYAIGSGMVYAKSPYESTLFAYLTESYKEYLQILYYQLDYPSDQLYAGTIGDFFLTGTNTNSRNFCYGRLLVQTKKEAQLFLEQNTVEGYTALKNVVKLLKKKEKFPLLYEIYKHIN